MNLDLLIPPDVSETRPVVFKTGEGLPTGEEHVEAALEVFDNFCSFANSGLDPGNSAIGKLEYPLDVDW